MMMTTTAAIDRIEFSRARLRQVMMPPPPAASGQAEASWIDRLESLPAVRVVIDAVSNWWARHPLRVVTLVAAEASSAAARPLAQSNPLALVVVAAIAGAVLAWSRPWRWLVKPALFAGLVPQVAARIVTGLPVESWAHMLSQWVGNPAAATPSPAAGSAAPIM